MSRLDDWGLREFWYRIGDIFARKTEAGGSLSWDGGSTLGLTSVAGGSLGSVNLDNGMATDAEATYSISISGTTITISNAAGTVTDDCNIGDAISNAITAALNDNPKNFLTQNAADARYARGLILAGKNLTLKNAGDGPIGNTVTLP